MHYQVVYILQEVLGDNLAFKKDGVLTNKCWAFFISFEITSLFREGNYFRQLL